MNPIYIHHFDTHNQYKNHENTSLIQFPHTSYTEEDELVRYNDRINYSKEYLTFEADTGNYLYLYVGIVFSNSNTSVGSDRYNRVLQECSDITLYYSLGDDDEWVSFNPAIAGVNWSQTTGGTYITTSKRRIKFKGDNWHLDGADWYLRFFPVSSCIVYGNILSIVDSQNFSNIYTVSNDIRFYYLFGITNDSATSYKGYLKTDKNKKLILQLRTLTPSCYLGLFCNRTMIQYAPELPARTLNVACYNNMFRECVNLLSAPALPAMVLPERCYYRMFENCSKINYIDCKAIDISGQNCLYNWLKGVSELGTFIKNVNADWNIVGNSGIPNNWTVIYK